MKPIYENEDGTWKWWYTVLYLVGLASVIGLSAYIGLHS